jgi:hypothetical protein
VEVHGRLPERAADTLMQCKRSLKDLVAQFLDLLLELLQVSLHTVTDDAMSIYTPLGLQPHG